MIIVRSRFPEWIGAGAITIWPFLFVPRRATITAGMLLHEGTHGRQQMYFALGGAVLGVLLGALLTWPIGPATAAVGALWAVEGYGAGQALWRWLYLVGLPLGLPIWWNPWRAAWERQAYRAEGRPDAEIDRILRGPLYKLKWI